MPPLPPTAPFDERPTPAAHSFNRLFPAPTPIPSSKIDHATLNPFGAVDINVGQAMRFAIRLSQFAGSGTITAACTTLVQIWNRNGASTPFDAQGLSTTPSRERG